MEAITTVVYYSSNKEDVGFESRIQVDLWKKKGDLPLVSITQKSVRFGDNYCVGDIGASEHNVWMQMLIGCCIAKTPFVTFAEADTLYPEGYFQYVPEDMNKRYWFEDVWIYKPGDNAYFLKGRSDCAHMVGREYMIKLLLNGMRNNPTAVFKDTPRPDIVHLINPILNFKTGHGLRNNTQTNRIAMTFIPYWGLSDQWKEFAHGI